VRSKEIREFYEAQLAQVRSDARDALASAESTHLATLEVVRSQGAAACELLERELVAARAHIDKLEERLAKWVGLDEAPLQQLHRNEDTDEAAAREEAAKLVADELEARGLMLP
jgi:hypothetical protein